MTVNDFFARTPMASLTRGDTVEEETAVFLEPQTEKSLLYPIDRVLRVTSYDGACVYAPERDYTLRGGRLCLCPGGALPVMPAALYYSHGDQPLLKVRRPDGSESPCFFSEGPTLAQYQVRVSYTHSGAWEGFCQPAETAVFTPFLQKLAAGRDVTVLFYGDSITYGANASLLMDLPPRQPPYPMLFTNALAALYGYTVRFAAPEAENTWQGALSELPAGGRGTLTYVNTAVGGWNSADGVKRLHTHVTPQITKHGCDLFVPAFGMNDGNRPPEETAANCAAIMRHVLALCPEAALLPVSTMLPNPEASNGWFASQPLQEAALLQTAEHLRAEGAACAVARMTSVSAAVLRKKAFLDYTGNNINHPNDFFSRVYAQTLLQTVVGYDGHVRGSSE